MLAVLVAGPGCLDTGQRERNTTSSPDGGGIDAPSGDDATVTDAGAVDSTTPDAQGCVTTFDLIVRDFSVSHPDFETYMATTATTGLVETSLGADGKPVYALSGGSAVTTGPDEFFQWYHDTSGVNRRLSTQVTLNEHDPTQFIYENYEFFPIDDQGFGNEGYDHNFHFTTELHARFRYNGGDQLVFLGEDDVWVFINGKLAIDLGGAHSSLEGSVDLDAAATTLGITPGNVYDLAIFHAERHTDQSVYTITTNISCFYPP